MKPIAQVKWGLASVGLLVGIVWGCRPAAEPPSEEIATVQVSSAPSSLAASATTEAVPPTATKPEVAAGEPAEPVEPPLVDHPEALQPLLRDAAVWFDKEQRQVVLVGTVCQNRVPLEVFACQRGTKEHESILSLNVPASVIHTGLLLAGADPGHPVQYQPEFSPAAGTEIDVHVVWQDEQGQRHQARGQDWVRQVRTGQAMDYPWVFAGSRFWTDPETHQEIYQADTEGDVICLSNFPSAVLDIPVQSSDANAELMFEAFTERIPPLGTQVTVLLKPKRTPPSSR